MLMASQYLANAAIGTRDVDPEQTLFVHDLAHMSVRDDENLVPREVLQDRSMRTLNERYDPDFFMYALGYVSDAPVSFPLSPTADRSLRRAWREAILDRPFAYLDTRVDVWLRQLTIGRPAVWAYHPIIDPNPYGYRIRFPQMNVAAKDYIEGFTDDANNGRRLFHTVWLYILLGVGAGLVLLRRGRSLSLFAVAALGLATLTHQVGLFFGAMVTAYRWENPVVVMAALAVAVLFGLWRTQQRPATQFDS